MPVRPGRRRACSGRPGATTIRACGCRTGASPTSWSPEPAAAGPPPETTKKAPRYIPNGGFLIVEDELGEVYVRLFSYARYLNQLGLDETYTDAFGKEHTVQRRQDAQLQKFFLPFSGWFLTPNFRYYLYVWSANTVAGRSGAGRGRAGTSAMCSTST